MPPEPLPHRIGFAVKVEGAPGLKSNDARRWQSAPHLRVSIEYLDAILTYLDRIDVRMYRISSDFVPYATHPDMPRFHGQIAECAAELRTLGARARALDVRLSLHPSQYVVLNAADDDVACKAIADLESQAELLDAMEQDEHAVVVLHVGGAYGDKAAAMQTFVRNFGRLSERAQRRLVIENDETLFTVEDCLWIHERIGTPLIFDHQHHLLNSGSLSAAEAARAALVTWPRGVTPKMHFSSPRMDTRVVKRGKKMREVPPLLSQHADYVQPWEFAGLMRELPDLPFDVMLEAKKKDLALLKLREDLKKLELLPAGWELRGR